MQPGTTVSPCWGNEAMWLLFQEMGRIMRTGGINKRMDSEEVRIEVVDVSLPVLIKEQSVWRLHRKHGWSTVMESTPARNHVTYNCTPMGVFSLEVGWAMCGEAEIPLMCLSYIFLVFALFYGWVVHLFCSGSSVVVGEPRNYLWVFQCWGFQQQWFMVVMGPF